MNRSVLQMLKGVGGLGFVGSAAAVVVAAFSRPGMFAQAVQGGRPMVGFEVVFDQINAPLQTLLMAGMLYAVADIALRMPLSPRGRDGHDH